MAKDVDAPLPAASFAAAPMRLFDTRDVSRDGNISALDALMVINALSQKSVQGEFAASEGLALHDTNGDGYVTALDALNVINYLNGVSDFNEAAIDDAFSQEDDDASWLAEQDLDRVLF